MTGPFRPSPGGPAGIPGQGGQQPVHPTVGNFGMPGGEVTIERPTYNAPPGAPQPPNGSWAMPPAPAPQQGTFPQQGGPVNQPGYPQAPAAPQPQQPHPTVPFGQQPPQPQGQLQAPVQPAGRMDLPDHVVLDGASVPPELRGRTWGQVKQIYGALASDFLMRQNGGQQPPAPQAPRQPQQPPANVQGVRNGGQPDRGTGSFWEDPEGTISRIVDTRLAPVTQRTTAMAIQEARQVAASGIPDWQQLEGEVMSIVAGATPEQLADPRLWQSTAELARGRLMGRGEYRPNGQPQQPNQPGFDPRFQRGPGAAVPAPVSPVQFFTEAPTPPQYGAPAGMNIQLTPEERLYAQRMQMSDQDYIAWRGGVQPTAPTRRY